MIRQKDSYVKEQKRSDCISQQCDLVEELSDEDLENVAGGALSGIAWSDAAVSCITYGVPPLYAVAVARHNRLMAPMNLRIRG